MFSIRNVIAASIVSVVIIVVGGVISVMQTPDSGGWATDTYGTRRLGYRGLFETLAESGVTVERRLLPPSPDMTPATTLVLWIPDPELVSVEPAYLQALGPWIERGGRVVVAPRLPDEREAFAAARRRSSSVATFDVLGALGVRGAVVRQVPPEEREAGTGGGRNPELDKMLRKVWVTQQLNRLETDFTATGTLAYVASRSRRIVVDRDKRARLEIDSDAKPAGTISYEADGERRVLAAAFARGAGEVIVLADESPAANALLGEADNAVVAYDLTAGGGRAVVFDEFYHGLAIRGNVLWLLTQPGYGLAAAAGLALLGLAVWRRGTLLGPPLAAATQSRRTITEYVDAMSRFFHRARGSRIFILAEVRTGVLRELARRADLPPAHADVERVAAALARRSAGESRRLIEAARLVDAAIGRGNRCTERESLVALEGITACL